jgi:hypothetical protein
MEICANILAANVVQLGELTKDTLKGKVNYVTVG